VTLVVGNIDAKHESGGLLADVDSCLENVSLRMWGELMRRRRRMATYSPSTQGEQLHDKVKGPEEESV